MSAPSGLSAAAYRGVGMSLLCLGTVLALLGAARLTPGDRPGTFQSQPVQPLLIAGVGSLIVAMVVLRRHRRVAGEHAAATSDTAVLCRRILAGLKAVQRGEPALYARGPSSGSMPLGLDVLESAPAPEGPDEGPYLLWLKVQLDPLVDDVFPELFAGRDLFRARRGLSAFAALFSALARGERLVLRVWSAAVDGYGDEARAALADAVAQFEECAALLPDDPPSEGPSAAAT